MNDEQKEAILLALNSLRNQLNIINGPFKTSLFGNPVIGKVFYREPKYNLEFKGIELVLTSFHLKQEEDTPSICLTIDELETLINLSIKTNLEVEKKKNEAIFNRIPEKIEAIFDLVISTNFVKV